MHSAAWGCGYAGSQPLLMACGCQGKEALHFPFFLSVAPTLPLSSPCLLVKQINKGCETEFITSQITVAGKTNVCVPFLMFRGKKVLVSYELKASSQLFHVVFHMQNISSDTELQVQCSFFLSWTTLNYVCQNIQTFLAHVVHLLFQNTL